MKKIFYYFTVVILTISCEKESILKEDTSFSMLSENQLYFIPDTCFFPFIYEGKTYFYGETKNENTEVTLRTFSQDGTSLYQDLMRKDNLCTIVKEDGTLEIYNTLEEAIGISKEAMITKKDEEQKYDNILTYAWAPTMAKYSLQFYDRDFYLNNDPNIYNYNMYAEIRFWFTNYFYQEKYSFDTYVYPWGNGLWGSFKGLKPRSFICNCTFEGTDPFRSGSINYVVFFEGSDYSGQTLVYENVIVHGVNQRYTELQLSRLGWADRIKSVLFMVVDTHFQ